MSRISIPVELENLGVRGSMTKEQIIAKMAEWARVGQANCDKWKAKAEEAARQYAWMFALPSANQPRNTIANMAIRLAKAETTEVRTQATCVVGSIKVDPATGEAYFEPICIHGQPIFGFRQPKEGEAPMENIISEWVLKMAVEGKIPHKYTVKYHGGKGKVVNQLELPGGKLIKGGRKVAEALG